jgi:hypothetical protein
MRLIACLIARKITDVVFALAVAARRCRQGDWRFAIKALKSVADRPGRSGDRWFYRDLMLNEFTLRSKLAVAFSHLLFRSVAEPGKVIWVNPKHIKRKTSFDLNLFAGEVLPGDWDVGLGELERTAKHRAMIERFQQGLDWQETSMFKEIYAQRYKQGRSYRGAMDLDELSREYERTVDALFSSLKDNGFEAVDGGGKPRALPHVHIGRDGELIFGNNGNHRLSMAKMLGIERIPCLVRTRHLEWQRRREEFAASGAQALQAGRRGADVHPDLVDIMQKRTERSRAEASAVQPPIERKEA